MSASDSKITITEFAEKINVSTATIWRAVYNRKGVSKKTRERILQEMAKLGYQPNQAARAVATRRSQMVSLWTPALDNTFGGLVFREMRRLVGEHGYQMIIQDIGAHAYPFGRPYMGNQWPVDGIIVLDPDDEVRCYLRAAQRPTAPIVCIGGNCEESVDYACMDLYEGALCATRHLIGIGRRRVAFLGPRSSLSWGRERREGYLTAVFEAGLTPELIITESELALREPAWLAAKAHIESHGAPDALFCLNDDQAIGAYRALRELGLRIPEDVALVGCDGIEETQYFDPPISTLVQPVYEMCAKAWEFLMRRIEDPAAPHQTARFKPELAIRASSSPKQAAAASQ